MLMLTFGLEEYLFVLSHFNVSIFFQKQNFSAQTLNISRYVGAFRLQGARAEQRKELREAGGGSLQTGRKQCGTFRPEFERRAEKISPRPQRDPRELRQFSQRDGVEKSSGGIKSSRLKGNKAVAAVASIGQRVSADSTVPRCNWKSEAELSSRRDHLPSKLKHLERRRHI